MRTLEKYLTVDILQQRLIKSIITELGEETRILFKHYLQLSPASLHAIRMCAIKCWPMCWPMCIFATTRKKSLVVFADQSIRIVALVQEAKAKS